MSAGHLDSNGIWIFGEDDNPDGTASGMLNLGQSATSAAVGALRTKAPYVWTNSAARTAQGGMAKGERGLQLDTGVAYRYSGSAWVVIAEPSLNTVSFSGVTNAHLDGVFTTAQGWWYDVIVNATVVGAGAINMLLRAAGVDVTTNYDNERLTADNATATAAPYVAAIAGIPLNFGGQAGETSGKVTVFNPALARATTGIVAMSQMPNPGVAANMHFINDGFSQRDALARDGVSLVLTGGTSMTGKMTVVGYSNG